MAVAFVTLMIAAVSWNLLANDYYLLVLNSNTTYFYEEAEGVNPLTCQGADEPEA